MFLKLDRLMFKQITLFAALLAFISIGLTTAFQLLETKIQYLPFIEFGLLGILGICLLTAGITSKNHPKRLISLILILILVTAQAYFVQLARTQPLIPILETVQMLLGFCGFWLLFRLSLYSSASEIKTHQPSPSRYLLIIASFVLFWQIGLGSWVSVNSAGLVCGDFPLCKPQLLKSADYQSGLDILSGVVQQYSGKLSFNARVAVQLLHRMGGLLTFVMLTWVMFSATSAEYAKPIRKAGLVLGALLLIEISLGIFSIKFSAPFAMVLAHNLLAALLMLPLMVIAFYADFAEQTSGQAILKPTSTDSVYLRLKSQLNKTRNGLGGVLTGLTLTQKGVTDELLEKIEESLLLADVGIEATTEIIDKLTDNLDRHELNNSQALFSALKQDLLEMLAPCDQPLQIPKQDTPFVILVVGINGAGKTTTIGKLAKKLQNQGYSVMLAAGDTFRAAAVEQLQVWGIRNEIPVVAQHTGADSASVIFDGLQSAKAKKIDVLIADTAGRLHTKSNLMEELKKIKRIMSKLDESAPHEVLLVLDAGTGQNALSQAKLFNEAVALTGLALTKLDGTAKGGIVFALAKQMKTPIRYIGVGEGIEDLQDFNAKLFVDAIFVRDE